MDETPKRLTTAVQAIADKDRFDLDEHPTLDQLADHRAGRLAAADSERIQDHLALCSTCTGLLLDLASFPDLEPPEGLEPVSAQEVEAAWRKMGPELLAAAGVAAVENKIEAEAQGDRLTDRLWGGLSRLFASPRFAYGLAAVLLLALPLTRYWTVQELTRPEFNVPIANLVPERGQPRSAPPAPGQAQTIRIPERSEQFLLVLNLVSRRSYTDYVVEVVAAADPGGPVTWRRAGLTPSAAGNFNLLVPRRFLPPGRYTIRLLGRDGDAQELVVEYLVQVEYDQTSQ